jgi:predicted NACHT family NTPase
MSMSTFWKNWPASSGANSTLNDLALTEFDRVGLGTVERSQIPGMQAVDTYAKLRVLGKPGVGKTTFLQHLAVQCNRGEFAGEQVPMFIALREFAEQAKRQDGFSLFSYIQQTFPTSGLADPTTLGNPAARGTGAGADGWHG